MPRGDFVKSIWVVAVTNGRWASVCGRGRREESGDRERGARWGRENGTVVTRLATRVVIC
eukprot:3951194-Pleurochrysis_carterae.AAC.1